MTVEQLRTWAEAELRRTRDRFWVLALTVAIPLTTCGMHLWTDQEQDNLLREAVVHRLEEHDQLVRDVGDLKEQINWVGEAVERLAESSRAKLPPRPLVTQQKGKAPHG